MYPSAMYYALVRNRVPIVHHLRIEGLAKVKVGDLDVIMELLSPDAVHLARAARPGHVARLSPIARQHSPIVPRIRDEEDCQRDAAGFRDWQLLGYERTRGPMRTVLHDVLG
jgi:hypothetical protein